MGLAFAAAVLTIVYVMFWSPLLEVRTVRVVGARHVSSEEVAARADLGEGRNLLRLSTEEVADEVEKLPWVKRAEVDRMLPGTVRVRIVEREPSLSLTLDGSSWVIDDLGFVLEKGPGDRLPVLAGIEAGGIEPGNRLQTKEAADALRAYRSLSAPLRARVAGVFAPTRERITLSLEDGTVIRYGAAERLVPKNRVLGALLRRARAEGRKLGYIDVRVPTNPAVAPVAPSRAEGEVPPPVSPAP